MKARFLVELTNNNVNPVYKCTYIETFDIPKDCTIEDFVSKFKLEIERKYNRIAELTLLAKEVIPEYTIEENVQRAIKSEHWMFFHLNNRNFWDLYQDQLKDELKEMKAICACDDKESTWEQELIDQNTDDKIRKVGFFYKIV